MGPGGWSRTGCHRILAWAVNVDTTGFNVNMVGYILLVVGIIGIILSNGLLVELVGPGYFTRNRPSPACD